MQHWLMKSEPTVFSIDDLANKPNKVVEWDGVRNYQARNFIRSMRVGDQGFFYHSSCSIPAIVGIIEIVRAAYPDKMAWDPNSPYYDPKASSTHPRWYCVNVQLVKKLKISIPLYTLRKCPELVNLTFLKRANRLSVMPITTSEWCLILNRTSV